MLNHEVPEQADAAIRLSLIVESSEDAIVSKDTEGVIRTWNAAAERLFGYTADEVIGKHITIIIPEDRWDEEEEILRRIRSGARVDHYETVRRRKDASLVDISLTVSPVRNHKAEIIGASKIARDITERKRAQQQSVLLREMQHRIKNLFALAASIVGLTAGADGSADVEQVKERLSALARAHDLTLADFGAGDSEAAKPTTLGALAKAIVAPYECEQSSGGRFLIGGPELPITGTSLTSMALLLHESTTNAVKYGALSTPAGRIEIKWRVEADNLVLTWRELGGPPVRRPEEIGGFGRKLARAAVAQLGGRLSQDWNLDGLCMSLVIPLGSFAT